MVNRPAHFLIFALACAKQFSKRDKRSISRRNRIVRILAKVQNSLFCMLHAAAVRYHIDVTAQEQSWTVEISYRDLAKDAGSGVVDRSRVPKHSGPRQDLALYSYTVPSTEYFILLNPNYSTQMCIRTWILLVFITSSCTCRP